MIAPDPLTTTTDTDAGALVERIPTILEVVAQRICGYEQLPHPTRGHEMYSFTAAADGSRIEITVSEFGPHAEAVHLILATTDTRAVEPL